MNQIIPVQYYLWILLSVGMDGQLGWHRLSYTVKLHSKKQKDCMRKIQDISPS